MKRILVINQYYAPDLASTGQYAADICAGLATYGFDVYVVTGMPSYSKLSPDAPQFEIMNGVKVYRVPLGKVKGRDNIKTRFKGYIQFLIKAWKKAKEILKKERFDIILTFHNPPFIGFLGALLARKYKVKFVYIPYDIHPDILLKTGWKIPIPFIFLWELINKVIFNTAEKIIVLSEGMKRTLIENKKVSEKKVKIVPLWAKPEIDTIPDNNFVRKELNIKEGDLILLHAGNMGILHPLEIILDAAKKLRDYPVKFLFIGDGAKREFLIERVQNENITNVFFLPFQPENIFINILSSVDICLVTIGRGLEHLAFPSKTFTYLSAQKPIIALMSPDADLTQMVKQNNCGWNAKDAKELTSIVINLLTNREDIKIKGLNAKKTYENYFNKKKIIDKYVEILLDS